jgi:uncharacterized short protein YbdD (DUF466 family)
MQIGAPAFNAYDDHSKKKHPQTPTKPQFGHVLFQTEVYKEFQGASRLVKSLVNDLKTNAKVEDGIWHDHHSPKTIGMITTKSKEEDEKIKTALQASKTLQEKGVTFFATA